VIAAAKQQLTRSGRIPPTILIEGTTATETTLLPELDEVLKHSVLEALGFTLATEHRMGSLVQLFLVFEAWRVQRRANEGYRGALQPKHAPDRIECGTVVRYQAEPETRQMVIYDMVRNTAGELTELTLTTNAEAKRVESPTLDALIRGFRRGETR
jgi:hypothetical protein